MKREGNFITKYWLKEFVWYDWRFLIQLPLFMAYMWIVLIMLFVFIGLQLLSLVLERLTNIRLWRFIRNVLRIMIMNARIIFLMINTVKIEKAVLLRNCKTLDKNWALAREMIKDENFDNGSIEFNFVVFTRLLKIGN